MQQPPHFFEVAWLDFVVVLTLLNDENPDSGNRHISTGFRESLIEFLDAHQPGKILVDFAGLSQICGLQLANPLIIATLLAAKKRTDQYHCQWRLCGMLDAVHERYVLARLDKIFPIHETRSEAIAAFEAA